MYASIGRNATMALFTDSDMFEGFTNAKGWYFAAERQLWRGVRVRGAYMISNQLAAGVRARPTRVAGALRHRVADRRLAPFRTTTLDRQRFQLDLHGGLLRCARSARRVRVAVARAASRAARIPCRSSKRSAQALLDGSRPKAEFWSEVERKGTLAKEKRAAEKELDGDPGEARARSTRSARSWTRRSRGARRATRRPPPRSRGNRSELARIEDEVAKREAALAGFERRRAEAPTP